MFADCAVGMRGKAVARACKCRECRECQLLQVRMSVNRSFQHPTMPSAANHLRRCHHVTHLWLWLGVCSDGCSHSHSVCLCVCLAWQLNRGETMPCSGMRCRRLRTSGQLALWGGTLRQLAHLEEHFVLGNFWPRS